MSGGLRDFQHTPVHTLAHRGGGGRREYGNHVLSLGLTRSISSLSHPRTACLEAAFVDLLLSLGVQIAAAGRGRVEKTELNTLQHDRRAMGRTNDSPGAELLM